MNEWDTGGDLHTDAGHGHTAATAAAGTAHRDANDAAATLDLYASPTNAKAAHDACTAPGSSKDTGAADIYTAPSTSKGKEVRRLYVTQFLHASSAFM